MSGSGLLRRRTPVALATILVAALMTSVGVAGPSEAKRKVGKTTKDKTIEVQLLGLNDFHGALEPPSGSGGRIGPSSSAIPAGGAEYLSTHVDALRATNPNTLFVSAGDLIGATPLTSALFHDEPTIEAFNAMELDYNGVGNHEFDEGVTELLRMQNGGCHPVDGCQDGTGFAGASFDFLAANVAYKSTGSTIFPGYAIHDFPGARVGIIGMTLEGTPEIVTPSGISSVDFADEADTVNRLVPKLRRQGVETIVVLLHEGGNTSTAGNGTGAGPADVDKCVNPTGAIPPIVDAMSDEVDVVVTGHTNWAVNCVLDGKIVTGAGSNGRLVTDIDLTIRRGTQDVIGAVVDNKIVTRDVPKDAAMTSLISKYQALAAPLANQVVGSVTADITTAPSAAGESAAGDVIADAQLAASAAPDKGGSVVAFMNAGGIRNGGLTYAFQAGSEAPGQVTYGELFTVQPFNNVLTVVSCTGAQIDALLEQQFTGGNGILQVSKGFSYAYDVTKPAGTRIDPATIKINGVTLAAGSSYRVTTNNFLVTGGDGYSTFTQCTDPLGGEIDLDALVTYFKANSPVAPGPQNRNTKIG